MLWLAGGRRNRRPCDQSRLPGLFNNFVLSARVVAMNCRTREFGCGKMHPDDYKFLIFSNMENY